MRIFLASGATVPNAYIELSAPTRARFVRYEHIHVGAANLAVSDIRVFGNGDWLPPGDAGGLTARRDRDERNAIITWQPVPGAVGYNVRWGISPSKLYQTYQRFADQGTTLELRALTVGQPYWVAIESFDENGVSTLAPLCRCVDSRCSAALVNHVVTATYNRSGWTADSGTGLVLNELPGMTSISSSGGHHAQ